MHTDKLKAFMEKIMAINTSFAGMGGASTGIIGAAGMGDQTVYQLKTAIVAFGSAYKRDAKSQATRTLSKEIEGLLPTIQVMSVISAKECGQLLDELYDLLEQPAAT